MSALLLRAAAWAGQMHADQRRKGTQARPYINHCLEVASKIAAIGGIADEAILAAAVLHDVVEDTSATLDDVRTRFGAEVAGYVAEVTDDKSLPKAERKRQQVVNAAKKSHGAKLIKLADKASNVHDLVADPPEWPGERLRAYVAWSREVLADMRGVNAALEAHFDDVATWADHELASVP